jgi:hypothetical protein
LSATGASFRSGTSSGRSPRATRSSGAGRFLVEAAFDLLAVLAALNRLYFTRFQLKRMRKLIGRMPLAPPDLADRLERLFDLEDEEAANELERLVEETQALVAAELPDLELRLRQPVGTRRLPWG